MYKVKVSEIGRYMDLVKRKYPAIQFSNNVLMANLISAEFKVRCKPSDITKYEQILAMEETHLIMNVHYGHNRH